MKYVYPISTDEYYSGLIETLYISSVNGTKESLIEGLKEPLDKMVNADELNW